jgi:hypothetical protein
VLSERSKTIRIVLSLAAAVTLCFGTAFGDDDNFPFGPFRMYSTKQELDGEVRAIEIYGLSQGRWAVVPFDTFGLRRADIEGQLGKLEEPPESVLAAMYQAYENIHGQAAPFDELQLRERTYDLVDGRTAREIVVVLGSLDAP